MRIGEQNNEDKIFVTKEELQKIRDKGEIAYEFDLLGNTYAYTKESLFTDKNTVFELHYNTIFDFKKICPHLRTIYLLPKDIEIAKEKTKERHLDPETEKKRLLEIDEHYNEIMSNKSLRNMFDYIIYNNYDKKSEENLIKLVKKMLLN